LLRSKKIARAKLLYEALSAAYTVSCEVRKAAVDPFTNFTNHKKGSI